MSLLAVPKEVWRALDWAVRGLSPHGPVGILAFVAMICVVVVVVVVVVALGDATNAVSLVWAVGLIFFGVLGLCVYFYGHAANVQLRNADIELKNVEADGEAMKVGHRGKAKRQAGGTAKGRPKAGRAAGRGVGRGVRDG